MLLHSPVADRRGFTLAELLIAIMIFAVVISLTYAAYNSTFKIINKAEAGSKYGERARITLERFSEDVGSFYLGTSTMMSGESETVNGFRADSLRFTSTAHLLFHKEAQARGYAVIAYSVVEQEDTGLLQLYRADTAVLPGIEPADEEERGFLLCDGLREVAFTYVDKDGNESESWSAEERGQNGGDALPALVRLKIGFADEEAEEATETLVHFSTAVAIPQTSTR